tara:strand:+ start:1715 stop:2242 length:528 start_codon:yes stop_codon:yes gene_type:complete
MTSQTERFPDVGKMKEILSNKMQLVQKENEEKKEVFMHNLEHATKQYYDNLLQNVYNATDYMENSKNTNHCVYVNVPTQRLKWGDKEEKFIPWHWIHYGFPDRTTRGWWNRDTKFWDDNDLVFRKIQALCREHNYFLYDISDPEKGNKTFFKLSLQREEEFEDKDLWHNFNKQLV